MRITFLQVINYGGVGVRTERVSSPVATLRPQSGGTASDIVSGLQTCLSIPENLSETHLLPAGLKNNSQSSPTIVRTDTEHRDSQHTITVKISEPDEDDSVSPIVDSKYQVDGRTRSRTTFHDAIGLNTLDSAIHMPIQFTSDGRLCRAFRACFDDIILDESV